MKLKIENTTCEYNKTYECILGPVHLFSIAYQNTEYVDIYM